MRPIGYPWYSGIDIYTADYILIKGFQLDYELNRIEGRISDVCHCIQLLFGHIQLLYI